MSASVEYPPVGEDFENLFNGKLEPPQWLPHIRVQGFVVPDCFRNFVDTILNFEVRDDDVWVCSFPKTGTTWTQEMVWCIANDLNFEAAKTTLAVRFPFFEIVALRAQYLAKVLPDVKFPPHVIDSLSYIRDLPSPRFIKTHLPFHLLPLQLQEGQTSAKIVYMARNAKDTCVSFYHHYQLLYGYRGTLDDFCSVFYNGSLPFSPFWGNIFGYWERRHDRNLLFLTFEEMKRDLSSSVRRTAKFLGKDLTDEQVAVLCDHLSFEKMRNNSAVNQEDHINYSKQAGCSQEGKFMRSGQVGEGNKKLSPDWVMRFDQWSEENLRGTGFSFDKNSS